MSGHSKWHNIKHKKGLADAKRGKIFTRYAKLIAIAVKEGGDDPEMNPTLRSFIANAKAEAVPNANIEKAIKKGAGDDKENINFDEIMYEGFGPLGTAIYVHVITDNRNRTVSNVKNIFSKNGGNMGAAGSVSWMFEKKGIILAKNANLSKDEAELMAIDAGASDIFTYDDVFEIITEPSTLMKVRDNLEKNGFTIEKVELNFIAKNMVKIENIEDAQKVLNFVDVLEEDEDVTNVYTNADIPDEIMQKLAQ